MGMSGSSPKMLRPERPTQKSLETVRIAEEESRLARRRGGNAEIAELDDVALGLDDPGAPVSAPLSVPPRDAAPEVDIEPREPAPFSIRPGLDVSDPFGGLVPVISEPPPTRAGVRVPRVLLSRAEIADLPIDPRSAFVLCHIDGSQTLEEILDVCAMPEADALELLERLRTMGVIAI
jgi:hypothetical protein